MSGIWNSNFSLQQVNALSKNTLVENLGIEFTEINEDSLIARMPVDDRTVQPMRLLHGGASVALAETMGSVASVLVLGMNSSKIPVGLEINANHLNSATKGFVLGKVKPIKIGRSIHVWRIEIFREDGKQVCESRLTISIIEKRNS